MLRNVRKLNCCIISNGTIFIPQPVVHDLVYISMWQAVDSSVVCVIMCQAVDTSAYPPQLTCNLVTIEVATLSHTIWELLICWYVESQSRLQKWKLHLSSERPSDRASDRAIERPKTVITRAPDVHLRRWLVHSAAFFKTKSSSILPTLKSNQIKVFWQLEDSIQIQKNMIFQNRCRPRDNI